MIIHFDFGLAYGFEIDYFDKIYKKSGISYKIYGFDANLNSIKYCENKYLENDNIKFIHGAISNSDNEYINLYFDNTSDEIQQGNSIYDTKNNINLEKNITVKTIKFSEWIIKNNINIDNSFNVLRANIEGAEWDLYTDLNKNNLLKKFSIFMGDGHDCNKIKELVQNDIPNKLKNLFLENNIKTYRFYHNKFRKNIYYQKLLSKFFPKNKEKIMCENIVEFIHPKKNQVLKNNTIFEIKWKNLNKIDFPFILTLRLDDDACTLVNNINLKVKKNRKKWKVNTSLLGNYFVIMIQNLSMYPEGIQISDRFKII